MLFIQKIKIIFQEAALNLSISQVGCYAQLLKCSNAQMPLHTRDELKL